MSNGVAAFGPFRLSPAERRLERSGVPVEIGGRALDILIELVNHAGRVVSKAELMSAIWADTTVVEGVLRTHVYNLRKALGDGVEGARYVTSVAGRGYCFVAPVVRSVAEAANATSDASNFPCGLPPRLARLTGRDDDVQTLAAQLVEHRFVTIVGAAGIGKTSVAVAVGHALLDHFGGAVCFVELGSLKDPALVAATVASTLGAPMHSNDVIESLQAFLRDKRVLLVLDNCEHVVDAAATLAEQLFLRMPELHLLTTSRESLRVEGEYPYRLDPLETPMDIVGLNADTIQAFPAVQVFLERAAAGGWSGELTDADVVVVAETCRRLDGIPLAIELAASFVAQCGLQGMNAVLDDRLGLLWKHGRRTAPARQQTLHALIAWSYDKLPEHERVVLRRLSVLVGKFTLDAAKAVVSTNDSTESFLDVVSELVAKSLLSASVENGSVMYRLLETTRVYVRERLAEAGELEGASLRHALFFTEHAQRAGDLGDVRAALKWSFASPTGHAAGVRLAAAVASMQLQLGLVSECESWCRLALDAIANEAGTFVELRLQEAFAIATMFSMGNNDDARRALVRGVELARTLGGVDDEVRLLGHLNSFLIRRGDFKEALQIAERSITPGRAARIAMQVRAEWMLAFSHHLSGNQTIAQEYCERALGLESSCAKLPAAASRDAQGFFNHPHLGTMARTLWLRGRPARALAAARTVVDRVAELKHPFERSSALILSEAVFIWCGQWADAERLLDTLFELVERYSLGSQRGAATALKGELLAKIGRPHEGCDLLRTAASMQKTERNASFATVYAGALAEGLAATGELNEALGTVEEAIAEAERRGGTFDLPELYRIKGTLVASISPNDGEAASEAFAAAIALARRQGALALELRATTALAQARLNRGETANVLDDLSTIYGKFTEGGETPDLRAARDVLERVNRYQAV